jgi:hypothetical protein
MRLDNEFERDQRGRSCSRVESAVPTALVEWFDHQTVAMTVRSRVHLRLLVWPLIVASLLSDLTRALLPPATLTITRRAASLLGFDEAAQVRPLVRSSYHAMGSREAVPITIGAGVS